MRSHNKLVQMRGANLRSVIEALGGRPKSKTHWLARTSIILTMIGLAGTGIMEASERIMLDQDLIPSVLAILFGLLSMTEFMFSMVRRLGTGQD